MNHQSVINHVVNKSIARRTSVKQRKKNASYFSQFITFLATMYNLITFCFWIYCLFFVNVEWEKSLLLIGTIFYYNNYLIQNPLSLPTTSGEWSLLVRDDKGVVRLAEDNADCSGDKIKNSIILIEYYLFDIASWGLWFLEII